MVGGLLILCIAGLMLIGPALNKVFGSVQQDMKLHAGQADILDVNADVNRGKQAESGKSQELPEVYGFDENGNIVDVSSDQVLVAGSNGERDYASILRDRNGKPIPTEDLTEEEQALIKELANSEHAVAQYEKALERISNYSNHDPEKFKTTTILVNGYPMNAMGLIFMLQMAGFVVDMQSGTIVTNSNINAETAAYVDEKADQVTDQVGKVSEASLDTYNNDNNPNTIGDVTDPGKTHKNAKDTCVAGRYTDTGTACKGYKAI